MFLQKFFFNEKYTLYLSHTASQQTWTCYPFTATKVGLSFSLYPFSDYPEIRYDNIRRKKKKERKKPAADSKKGDATVRTLTLGQFL